MKRKRTVSQQHMTGLENRAEYNVPTLKVNLKPTMDVILDSGASFRQYPCATEWAGYYCRWRELGKND